MPYSPNGRRGCSSVVGAPTARPVDPDRAAVQEVLHLAAQRLDQLLGAVQREADHVDHDLAVQGADALAEVAVSLGCGTIDRHLAHLFPGGVRLIGGVLAARDVDDCVTCLHEPGDQVRTDMTLATNYHNAD